MGKFLPSGELEAFIKKTEKLEEEISRALLNTDTAISHMQLGDNVIGFINLYQDVDSLTLVKSHLATASLILNSIKTRRGSNR